MRLIRAAKAAEPVPAVRRRKAERFASTGAVHILGLHPPFSRITGSVVDISADGMMVDAPRPGELGVGSDVEVQLGSVVAVGTVRHVSRGLAGIRIGLHFEEVC